MTTSRPRALRALALALAACAAAAQARAPAAAQQAANAYRTTQAYAFVRTAGACPKSVVVDTHARGYEGGAQIEIAARTRSFAVAPRVAASAPARVEFRSPLRPQYLSCEAAARFSDAGHRFVLVLHAGSMRYVFIPGAEVTLLRTSVATGEPAVTLGVAD